MAREDIAIALESIRHRIRAACERVGRDPAEVTVVAVAKTVPATVVRTAAALRVSDFGENYAKELSTKAAELDAFFPSLLSPSNVRVRWHFVGKLQRGTASLVADHADVIHSAEPGDATARVASRAA